MKAFYSNIGKKLCTLAMICGCIGIGFCAIGCFVTLMGLAVSEPTAWIIGLCAVGTGVISLISSWPLYAFGQITNDVHEMKAITPTTAPVAQFTDLPDL